MMQTESGQSLPDNDSSPRGRGRGVLAGIIGLVVVAAIVGAGYLAYTRFFDQSDGADVAETQTAGDEATEAVAVVNNEEIARAELDKQVKQIMAIQGVPIVSEQERQTLERQVLEQMINDRLLYEEAQRQGISATTRDVTEQYNEVVEDIGGEEALTQRLTEVGLTMDEFRESLERQVVMEQYFDRLKSEHNISVSDEEVRAVYDQQVAGQETEITFESVAERLRDQLEQQQLAEVIPDILADLREQAGVEILL